MLSLTLTQAGRQARVSEVLGRRDLRPFQWPASVSLAEPRRLEDRDCAQHITSLDSRPGRPPGSPAGLVPAAREGGAAWAAVPARRTVAGHGQLASPITSHMKPAPATVQASVRRLGWLAWASGRMSEVA